jgi:2-oxoglutarate ferredoxin oxidoreductase subunit delta
MTAKKKTAPAAKKPPAARELPEQSKLSFYPAWCKRCGNCVAFCPRQALAQDERGRPYLADPERCTSCGLCEMLCPDFALSVGEGPAGRAASGPSPGRPGSPVSPNHSPERLAPAEEDR